MTTNQTVSSRTAKPTNTRKKKKQSRRPATFKTVTASTRRTKNMTRKAEEATVPPPTSTTDSCTTARASSPIRISANQASSDTTKKSEKTPPIIIHRKRDFSILEKGLKLARLIGFSATDQKDSLRANTDNSTIYRKVIDFLDRRSIAFHCYTVREDKKYRIVLKGIPEDFEDTEVEDMLREEGYPVIRAQRMKKGQNRTPMALMLLDIEHTEEGGKKFAIQKLGNYKVSVETLKCKTELGQCHNCQMYGHSQTGCHAPPKCV